jgi:WD40 repeat protein/serine/threonine protein kinase
LWPDFALHFDGTIQEAAPMNELEIFSVALEMARPDERSVYLDQACGENVGLRQRIEALLQSYAGVGSFMASPAPGPCVTAELPATREKAGVVIGPYKLLQQIGEGGMGTVFMAEQSQPVQRRVALKIIKPGLDSKQIIARFEAERQALAMMDHVNIARVLDAGATEAGRPYFVMELVHGVPFTQYCDDNHLTPRQRLELFVPVCQAIQHAHQKGIIHRDVKPSNVMITLYDGQPVPKVIDFGVAKATEQRLTERTLFTQYGTMVGTLEYMSPEQAEMSALGVDTRSDIYSLGVLLYELLTGSTPLSRKRLKEAADGEILRMIKEEEPQKPSTRLSDSGEALASISAQRKTEPAKLSKLMRGELDWIVMKTLEKDRNRRYETASGFAADVQRYLNDEQVQACPPSARYRLRKFTRRNKRALATAALLSVMLLVAVGAVVASALWAAVQAKARLEVEAVAKKELERNLYFTHIALAERELSANNWGRAEELLDECPAPLRDWEWNYLKRRRQAAPVTLSLGERVAMGSGFDVAFSPDGRRLAAPIRDKTIIWDAATGQELLTLQGHTDQVRRLAFSRDGRRLATASKDKTVKVWDVAPDHRAQITEPLLTLCGHKEEVNGVAFSPDGHLLASSGFDQKIKVWEAATGKELQELPALLRRGQPRSGNLAFSPDNRLLACGGPENTVKVWEAATGREIFSLRGHHEEVFSVIFSPDGQRLASVAWDNLVKVWDLTTGQEAFNFLGNGGGVWGTAFSPDGQHLAVGGGMFNGMVKVYDLTTGDLTLELYGHTERVISVAYSPDGRRLASAGFDKTVRLWEMTTGREVLPLREHTSLVGRVVFSPDGRRLASASQDGTLKVWDGTPPEEDSSSRALTLHGHTGIVYSVAFSPDGWRLASGSRDNTVKVWEVATGKEVFTLPGHTGPILCVAFSPDGRRLASSSYDKTVKLWDARTGQEALALRTFKGFVQRVAFSPADGRLATADSYQNVQVWDGTTGKELPLPLQHAGGYIYDLAFSPDGKRLATVHADQTVKLWDSTTGQALGSLRGHDGPVLSVAFSPDGKLLASGSVDQTVKVWDAATGKEVCTLPGHSDYIFGMAFSPEGRHLASASWGEVLVRDVQTGEPVQALRGHAGAVWSVAFSPDGQHLAAAGGYKGKGEIKIWDATLWTRKPAQP